MTAKKQFRRSDLRRFRKDGINFPLFIVNEANQVVEVHSIEAIGGMNANGGIPNYILYEIAFPDGKNVSLKFTLHQSGTGDSKFDEKGD